MSLYHSLETVPIPSVSLMQSSPIADEDNIPRHQFDFRQPFSTVLDEQITTKTVDEPKPFSYAPVTPPNNPAIGVSKMLKQLYGTRGQQPTTGLAAYPDSDSND